MKLLSFDLEISNEFEDEAGHPRSYREMGISCAAVLAEDSSVPVYWHSPDRLSEQVVARMVDDLEDYVNNGYTLVTWNGLAFDFRTVAENAPVEYFSRVCALARNHWDIMLQFVITKGYRLGLDACAKGCNVQTKKDLDGGHGENVPRLWREGRYEEVLYYLGGDVETTMQVAKFVRDNRGFDWVSKSGRNNSVTLGRPLIVSECMSRRVPPQSWITDPPKIEDMAGWMTPAQKSLFE